MKKTPLLKNVGELAEILTGSRDNPLVKRMKWAGFKMPGGRATVEWALEWLKNHPDFRQSDYLKPLQGDGRQETQSECKRHEQYRKHVRRKLSSSGGYIQLEPALLPQ